MVLLYFSCICHCTVELKPVVSVVSWAHQLGKLQPPPYLSNQLSLDTLNFRIITIITLLVIKIITKIITRTPPPYLFNQQAELTFVGTVETRGAGSPGFFFLVA